MNVEQGRKYTLFIPNSPETAIVAAFSVIPNMETREHQLQQFGRAALQEPLFTFRAFHTGSIITKPIGRTDADRNRLHAIHPLLAIGVTYDDLPQTGDNSQCTGEAHTFFVTDLHRNAFRIVTLEQYGAVK